MELGDKCFSIMAKLFAITVPRLAQAGRAHLVLTISCLFFLFHVAIDVVTMIMSKELTPLCLLFGAQAGLACPPDIFLLTKCYY